VPQFQVCHTLKKLVETLRAQTIPRLGLHPLARIPWSSIRRVGQSKLLSLTIVVPFLGSLLLFNQYVVDVLSLSPALVNKLFPRSGIGMSELAREVTLSRLYFLYFGLSFLGAGAFLFTVVCPLEIKNHASARDYAETEAPLLTTVRLSLMLPAISSYFLWWDETEYEPTIFERWKKHRIAKTLAFPTQFAELFAVLLSELFEKLSERDEGESEASAHYRAGPGMVPNVWQLAEVLEAGRRVDNWVRHGLMTLAAAPEHRTDVLTLHYVALDHSRPLLRGFVWLLYAAGFVTLLLPTVATFVRLAANVASFTFK
jgi:hypothetical protein